MAKYSDEDQLEELVMLVNSVFRSHNVVLKDAVEGCQARFADEMVAKGLINQGIRDNYTGKTQYDKIMQQYKTGLDIDPSVKKIEDRCLTFIKILKRLGENGGPLKDVVLLLEQDIKKKVKDKFQDLDFLSQPINSSRSSSLDAPKTPGYVTPDVQEESNVDSDSKTVVPSHSYMGSSSHAQTSGGSGYVTEHSLTSHPTEDIPIPIPMQPASDPTTDGTNNNRHHVLVGNGYGIKRNTSYPDIRQQQLLSLDDERKDRKEAEKQLKEEVKAIANREREISDEQTQERRDAQKRELEALKEQIDYLRKEIQKMQEQRNSEREHITKQQKDLEERKEQMDERTRWVEEREREIEVRERQVEKQLDKDKETTKQLQKKEERMIRY